MWQVKTFRTRQAMLDWVEKNEGLIECEEVFVNDGYAVEYRKLRVINMEE